MTDRTNRLFLYFSLICGGLLFAVPSLIASLLEGVPTPLGLCVTFIFAVLLVGTSKADNPRFPGLVFFSGLTPYCLVLLVYNLDGSLQAGFVSLAIALVSSGIWLAFLFQCVARAKEARHLSKRDATEEVLLFFNGALGGLLLAVLAALSFALRGAASPFNFFTVPLLLISLLGNGASLVMGLFYTRKNTPPCWSWLLAFSVSATGFFVVLLFNSGAQSLGDKSGLTASIVVGALLMIGTLVGFFRKAKFE